MNQDHNQTNQEPNILSLLTPFIPALIEKLTGQKLTQPNNNAELLTVLTSIQQQQLQFQQELMKVRQELTNFQQQAIDYLQKQPLAITN
jgi:hypothetical protein